MVVTLFWLARREKGGVKRLDPYSMGKKRHRVHEYLGVTTT
jgi:hypothetical protein